MFKFIFYFIRSTLRGISQIVFINNAWTGLFFIVSISLHSIHMASSALLGASVSTATAIFNNWNKEQISNGNYGFNATLTATALTLFFESSFLPIYVALAAIMTTYIQRGYESRFVMRLPLLTFPFIATTWVWLLASYQFTSMHFTLEGEMLKVNDSWSTVSLFNAALLPFGEIFLIDSIQGSLLILLGIGIGNYRYLPITFLAIGLTTFIAWCLGASANLVEQGSFTFNTILVALALFNFLQRTKFFYLQVMFGCLISVILNAAILSATVPVGLPPLTAPFLVTTWLMLQYERRKQTIPTITPSE